MRILGFAALMFAVPACGAQTAIRCDLQSYVKSQNYAEPDGVVEKKVSYTFVINDDAKTLKRLNTGIMSLEDWCRDCSYTFGLKMIGYSKLDIATTSDRTVVSKSLMIDREAGTFSWRFTTMGRAASPDAFFYETKLEGPCVKVAMPVFSAPKAKF